MKNIFTYPNNAGTHYIDPNYVGDATTGFEKRVDDLRTGAYRAWQGNNPIATGSTNEAIMSNTAKFYNAFKESWGEVTFNKLWERPMIVKDTELIQSNISDAQVGDLTDVVINFAGNHGFYEDQLMELSGFDGSLAQLNGQEFYVNKIDADTIKLTQTTNSDPIQFALAKLANVDSVNLNWSTNTPVLFTASSGYTLTEDLEVVVRNFDGAIGNLFNNDVFYAQLVDANNFTLSFDSAGTEPLNLRDVEERKEYNTIEVTGANEIIVNIDMEATFHEKIEFRDSIGVKRYSNTEPGYENIPQTGSNISYIKLTDDGTKIICKRIGGWQELYYNNVSDTWDLFASNINSVISDSYKPIDINNSASRIFAAQQHFNTGSYLVLDRVGPTWSLSLTISAANYPEITDWGLGQWWGYMSKSGNKIFIVTNVDNGDTTWTSKLWVLNNVGGVWDSSFTEYLLSSTQYVNINDISEDGNTIIVRSDLELRKVSWNGSTYVYNIPFFTGEAVVADRGNITSSGSHYAFYASNILFLIDLSTGLPVDVSAITPPFPNSIGDVRVNDNLDIMFHAAQYFSDDYHKDYEYWEYQGGSNWKARRWQINFNVSPLEPGVPSPISSGYVERAQVARLANNEVRMVAGIVGSHELHVIATSPAGDVIDYIHDNHGFAFYLGKLSTNQYKLYHDQALTNAVTVVGFTQQVYDNDYLIADPKTSLPFTNGGTIVENITGIANGNVYPIETLTNSTTGTLTISTNESARYRLTGGYPYIVLPGNTQYLQRTGESTYVPNCLVHTSYAWCADPNGGNIRNFDIWPSPFEVFEDGNGRITSTTAIDTEFPGQILESDSVMFDFYTEADTYTPPGQTPAEQQDNWDTASEWDNTSVNFTKEWPKHVSPASAKLRYEQPNTVTRSMSGKKYVRNSGHTNWYLDVAYPPMTEAQFREFNAMVMSVRGQYHPFFFVNQDKNGQPLLLDFSRPENPGELKVKEYVPAGSTTVLLEGFSSFAYNALAKGELVITGSENGNIRTVINQVNSNAYGEALMKLAYPTKYALNVGDSVFFNPYHFVVTLADDGFEYDIDTAGYYYVNVSFEFDEFR